MRTSKAPTQMAHPSSPSLPVGGIRDLLLGGALGRAAGAAGELLHQGLSTASPQPVILFKQPCCLKGWPGHTVTMSLTLFLEGGGRGTGLQNTAAPPPPRSRIC